MSSNLLFFQLKKEALDDYVGKELVPAFQIELKMIKFQSLEQRVGFVGVTPENSFVTITRDPPKQGRPLAKYIDNERH